MPITNGYVACQDILAIYKREITQEEGEGALRSIKIMNNWHLKPFMAACSGEVMSDDLQSELDEAGFDQFYPSPLKSIVILESVNPALAKR